MGIKTNRDEILKKIKEVATDAADKAGKVVEAGATVVKEKAPVIAEKVSEKAQEGAAAVGVAIDEVKFKTKEAYDNACRERYQPIFIEGFDQLSLPSILKMRDDPLDSRIDVLQGAIGIRPVVTGKIRVAEILSDQVDLVPLRFLPTASEVIYLQNPYKKSEYIAIDEYFDYIRSCKIAEFSSIAHSLGATKFTLTMTESKKTYIDSTAKADANLKAKSKKKSDKTIAESDAAASYSNTSQTCSEFEILLDETLIGHTPNNPELLYLSDNEDIKALIESRMNNGVIARDYRIKQSSSKDISINVAMNIDSVIKKYGLIGDASCSVKSQVEDEKRCLFNYHIEF